MAEKKSNALILIPSGGLENIGSGPKSILSGMVSDALALARVRQKSLAAARFRIGDYEFRDPDYRQILIWANALGLEPEDLVLSLENSVVNRSTYQGWREVKLDVEDGSIVGLAWNFDTFPISSFEWVSGLRIERLGFRGLASTKIFLRLPSLNSLVCRGCGLSELDLSKVPALIELNCSDNSLVELDLSMMPALIRLDCERNQLVELHLAAASVLAKLYCNKNHLFELDLSALPALNQLSCGSNQLMELGLSTVPALTELYCDNNHLVELDLSAVPTLSWLSCSSNQLKELGLSKVPALTHPITHMPVI